MQQKILTEFKTLNITNKNLLTDYIEFCIENSTEQQSLKTSFHHILPKSIFEDYSDLSKNDWNGVHLTYENHYKAHSILAEAVNHPSIIGAWWGMNFADRNTKGVIGLDIIGAEKHAKLFEKAVKETSERNSGLVMCRLKTSPDKSIKVSTEEYNNNRHLYLGNTEGKLSVIEKATNKRVYINKEDYNKEEHIFHKTGIKVPRSIVESQILGREKVQKQASEKLSKTLLKIMPDGRTKAQHNLDNRKKLLGSEHPNAKEFVVYNNKNIEVLRCLGNLDKSLIDAGIPSYIYGTLKGKKLGTSKISKTSMANKGHEKFIGWYLIKLSKS